jgi:hypothetical protein
MMSNECRGNPFNRRRDILKTASPVTSIQEMTKIPTQLHNLSGRKKAKIGEKSLSSSASSDVVAIWKESPTKLGYTNKSRENSVHQATLKVSWAADVKDHTASTRPMLRKKPLPRRLPPDFTPSDKDIVIEFQDEGESSDSITSLRFEVMLYESILQYIRSSRQDRAAIIDRILAAVSAEQGRFVRYFNGTWIQVDHASSREFIANELKMKARDVLKRIHAKRQAMQNLLRLRQQKVNSAKITPVSNKVQVKCTRPKQDLAIKAVMISSEGEDFDNCQTNPLEMLSQVALSLGEENADR